MRVHRITVKDVKGVREQTLDFPERGVVVVEGPNEIGKSTILEAFDKLLDPRLKATSVSKEVRRLQPVGKDVGPYVEAEFTVGGQRVRYAKRWLRQPTTTLEVLSPTPTQLSGEAAQAHLDRLIAASLDRTLWDALRFTQAQDGTVAPLVDSSVLSSALDAAAGSQLHAEEGEQVLDLVAKEYSCYFTRTGRPTGDYKQAMTFYTEAQAGVAEAHRRLEEADVLLARQGEARAAVETVAQALEVARVEHDAARQTQAAVAEIVSAHERARARLGEASEKSRSASRARQQRRELVAAHAETTAKVAAAQQQLEEDRAAAAALVESLSSAEESVTEADERVEVAEGVCEVARADADHLSALATTARLQGLVTQVEDLVQRLAAAREVLPPHPVTRAQLTRVEDLESRMSLLQAKHEVASAQVRVESLGAPVEVAMSEPGRGDQRRTSQDHDAVEPGAEATYRLTQETVVTVPGAVRVVIEPEESSQARAAELAEARVVFERALVEHGVESVADLREAVDEHEQAAATVRELARELEVVMAARPAAERQEALAGHLPGPLTAELASLQEQTEAYAADRRSDAVLPPDETTAAAVSRAAVSALQQARLARKSAADTARELRQRAAALRSRLDNAAGRLESDRARLDQLASTLEQARGQVADEVLDEQVAERSRRLAEVELDVGRARRAVEEADVDGIARRVLSAASQVDVATSEHDRASAALHTLTGQIEMAASEGRREHYDLAVAALDEAERHLASLDRRARAARHLWRTLQAHRDAAHRAYVLPYTRALEELGRGVYGDGFSVTVDEQLTLAARTLDGTTVPFDELSGGAKEQLGILARLAVARLVDPTQGVPVVIDDALGYSDPERLQQMGEVLGASATGADVQVILLTCTPERYAAIPHATTVRLSA